MMTKKEIKQEPVSEVSVDTGAVQVAEASPEVQAEQVRQVPLEALEAERRKRQDIEAQNRLLQDYVNRIQQPKDEPATKSEDDEDLVNKRDLKQFRQKLTSEEFATMKREIAEETFKEVNPEAIRQINANLKEILERKPWLAKSIEDSSNRYARAYEIVQDYAPALQTKKSQSNDAHRIVENSKKPGSPVSVGKTPNLSGADYLKSIAGTKEFQDYRQKVRQGG
jgi:hypothetical protein